MTIELLKQLKEAGFPNKILFVCMREDHDCRADKDDCKISCISEPTLSELIKACGDNLKGLMKREDGSWDAVVPDSIPVDYSIDKTPEEAVKRLWLALNKK